MTNIKTQITGEQLNELTSDGRDALWKLYEEQGWYPVPREESVLLSLSPSNKGRLFPLLTNDNMRDLLKILNQKKTLSLTHGEWLYTEAWLDSVNAGDWCDALWEKVKTELND